MSLETDLRRRDTASEQAEYWRTVQIGADSCVERLGDENTFLRQQITVKDEQIKREGPALALSACDRDESAIEADSNLLGKAIAQAIIEAYRAGITTRGWPTGQSPKHGQEPAACQLAAPPRRPQSPIDGPAATLGRSR